MKWHGAGSLSPSVLKGIVKYCSQLDIKHSLETGAGKSTLVFSHLSKKHKVFAIDKGNKSIALVKDSPLLNNETVEFVDGPTQLTLPGYRFNHKLQAALIDGPHGYPFPDLEYYYIYPLLDEGAVLIVDDIDIPMVYNLFRFIKADDMFSLVDIVFKTAFFRRTDAPLFDPLSDGWWLQNYNKRKLGIAKSILGYLRWIVPGSAREAVWRVRRKFRGMPSE